MKVLVGNTEVLSAAEAAEALGVSLMTIYRWMKSGKITPIQLIGKTFIPKSEIDRLNGLTQIETTGSTL